MALGRSTIRRMGPKNESVDGLRSGYGDAMSRPNPAPFREHTASRRLLLRLLAAPNVAAGRLGGGVPCKLLGHRNVATGGDQVGDTGPLKS